MLEFIFQEYVKTHQTPRTLRANSSRSILPAVTKLPFAEFQSEEMRPTSGDDAGSALRQCQRLYWILATLPTNDRFSISSGTE